MSTEQIDSDLKYECLVAVCESQLNRLRPPMFFLVRIVVLCVFEWRRTFKETTFVNAQLIFAATTTQVNYFI